MSKIRFVEYDSTDDIEKIESEIIPRKGDVVVITKGKYLVHAVIISYVTDEIIVYCM